MGDRAPKGQGELAMLLNPFVVVTHGKKYLLHQEPVFTLTALLLTLLSHVGSF